jgi:protein-tyrosine phosphatase
VRLLFVCTGNICRSPTAEAVMARLVREAGLEDRVTVDSADLGGWHVGELPDPRSIAAARGRGIELTHAARQLTGVDLERFDLLLVMDHGHLREVQHLVDRAAARRLPGSAGGPGAAIRLLRSFDASAPPGAEVRDPYSRDTAAFEAVLDQCERACAGLLEHVRAALAAAPAAR